MKDDYNNIKEVEETVKILVSVKIEYNGNNINSRKEAIQTAIKNTTGINTYGYPVTVLAISAKEVKR